MLPRDGRSLYQHPLRCIKATIVGTRSDQEWTHASFVIKNGDVFRVDTNRFERKDLMEFAGEECYIQFTEDGECRMVCDIIRMS